MPYTTRTHQRGTPTQRPPAGPQPPRPRIMPGSAGILPPQAVLPTDWSYTLRAYLSFDPASTAYPTWVEITPWVETEAATTITRGRQDGLSDVNAGTCTLTVDNSDGRFTAGNPNGAWYGQIRKGSWLRVDAVTLSGATIRRFTGFLTALPTTWKGKTAAAQISASDRTVRLAQAPNYTTMMSESLIQDPTAGQYLAGYWTLHEPQGATYAADVSGRAPAGAQDLAIVSLGPPGITFSNTASPGFDGEQTAAFAPSGGPTPAISGIGFTGAQLNGSMLTGTIGPSGPVWVVTCWINTTTAYQPIWVWNDPASNYSLGIGLDPNGYLYLWQGPLTGSYLGIYPIEVVPISRYPLDDGEWHQIALKAQAAGAPGGLTNSFATSYVDGGRGGAAGFSGTTDVSTGFCPPRTLSQFQIGGVTGWTEDESMTAPAFFTGAISDLSIHIFPTATINPDLDSQYTYGTTGGAGQDTGLRVLTLAQMAGLAVPTAAGAVYAEGYTVQRPTYGTTPGVAIPGPLAHPVGAQQIVGRNPVDVMREAARTEDMPLLIDRMGRLTLAASTLRQNPPTAFTIDAADLDDSTSIADDFQYTFNQTSVTPNGQNALIVNTNGLVSQAQYGIITGPGISTASLNTAEATSLGAAINARSADPPPRPQIVAEVAALARQTGYGAAWYDTVLNSDVNQVLAVTNWPSQAPAPNSNHYTEGYTETFQDGQHKIAWSTSPTQGSTYTCDDPVLGALDTPGVTLAY